MIIKKKSKSRFYVFKTVRLDTQMEIQFGLASLSAGEGIKCEISLYAIDSSNFSGCFQLLSHAATERRRVIDIQTSVLDFDNSLSYDILIRS